MSGDPLPTTLDVRKAAARSAEISGVIRLDSLQRFSPLLADTGGQARAVLTFLRDEEERYLVRVAVEAEVVVTCQRCLQPMDEVIRSDNTLAIVWNDAQAAALPKALEPLVLEDTICDLHSIVEDELILARKPFSYHDTETCRSETRAFFDPQAEVTETPARENPFEVLAQLTPKDKTEQ